MQFRRIRNVDVQHSLYLCESTCGVSCAPSSWTSANTHHSCTVFLLKWEDIWILSSKSTCPQICLNARILWLSMCSSLLFFSHALDILRIHWQTHRILRFANRTLGHTHTWNEQRSIKPVWMRRCARRLPLVTCPAWHTGHTWGLSPVWKRMWRDSLLARLNAAPQMLHKYGVSPGKKHRHTHVRHYSISCVHDEWYLYASHFLKQLWTFHIDSKEVKYSESSSKQGSEINNSEHLTCPARPVLVLVWGTRPTKTHLCVSSCGFSGLQNA